VIARVARPGELTMDGSGQGSAFHVALDIWARRRWLCAGIFLGAFVPVLSFIASLPDIFRASTTVLVERQQAAESFVRPSVTEEVEMRLHAISEEVMGRSKLNELIARFDLYPSARGKASPQVLIDRMRRDITLNLKGVERTWDRGGTVAFSLGYRGRDADKVADVTNALAALFVEQNLKAREEQATLTADFLKSQLGEIKTKLEAQESRIGQYRKRHSGELPQQVESNIAVLDRLNSQLQLNNDKQVRAMERRDRLTGPIGEAGAGNAAASPADPEARLDRLTLELAELRRQYTDNYPDVKRVEREIADLKREIAEAPPEPAPKSVAPSHGAATESSRKSEMEMTSLKRDEDRLRRTIAAYERKIELAPQRQQEFEALSRDYETTKELYDTLLKRYQESLVAESMEHGKASEQFRILDPALPPREPVAPNRAWLALMGLMFSVGLAVAAMAVVEQVDTTFHSVDGLRAFTRVPVLARIPRISTRADSFKRVLKAGLAVILLATGIAAAAGASYYIAHGSEQLVFILSGSRS
jgi:polysaccharide chain length determinant protein (PEP-CTERM system associated)